MPLVDWEILAAIEHDGLRITPQEPHEFLNGHSLDVRLGDYIRDPETEELFEIEDSGFRVEPDGFWLGSTLELFVIPTNMIMRVENKSTLARQGLFTHLSAGFVDGGFAGEITLEIKNVSRTPYILQAGQRIAHMSFERTATPRRPYGHPHLKSRYFGQTGPTAARPRPA